MSKKYFFNALTCIDPVTNLVEMIRIDNITSRHFSQQFESCWLNRYPRPNKCIHDKGGEFIGWEFQELLETANIIDSPTTSCNPQTNSICERLHQTVANSLRATVTTRPPQNVQQAKQIVDNALSNAIHITRCAVSRSLGVSPGALVFRRDMFLDIPIISDPVEIQRKRQVIVDENLRRQNQKRREFNYSVGQELLMKTVNPDKLGPRSHRPYVITRVYTNGTVDIQRSENVTERINIRRIIPLPTIVLYFNIYKVWVLCVGISRGS